MKEATGELSTTVITVVAIAAVAAIFTVWLLPSMRSALKAKTYCQQTVDCTSCNNNKMTCKYYEEDSNGKITTSNDTIVCPCDEGK
ncbi:MAG: hypothetical protein GX951_02090 [Mollicutes bacterium]|nr:hypothetical protein [Mollicutes bacterium]